MADAARALVIGASRGVGRGAAVALAGAGFDLVLAARTRVEGERREHGLRVGQSDLSPLVGSLQRTARQVRATGRRAWVLPLDLNEYGRVASLVRESSQRFGPFGVVVNAARYVGPGHADRFLETPLDLLERQLAVNVLGTLEAIRGALPGLVDTRGTVVNITSGAAVADPPAVVGDGGWSVGYGMTKAALHRACAILAREIAERGVRLYNLEPGSVESERSGALAGIGIEPRQRLSTQQVGRVVVWLCGEGSRYLPVGAHVTARDVLRRLGESGAPDKYPE